MFLGHFAVALAAKRAAPRASLGTLVAAGQAIDLLWPLLVLLGLESFRIEPGNTAMTPLAFDSYPWSHSLLMTLLLAIVFGAVVARWGSGLRSGVVAGCAVSSHWLLDYLTHRPDLQLVPWVPDRVGLGLWDYPAAAIPLEGSQSDVASAAEHARGRVHGARPLGLRRVGRLDRPASRSEAGARRRIRLRPERCARFVNRRAGVRVSGFAGWRPWPLTPPPSIASMTRAPSLVPLRGA